MPREWRLDGQGKIKPKPRPNRLRDLTKMTADELYALQRQKPKLVTTKN